MAKNVHTRIGGQRHILYLILPNNKSLLIHANTQLD